MRKEGKGMKNLILPEDLMVEILLRLPVRSLLRFKCVCKSWLSVISDPKFAESHFDLAATPTHRLLQKFSTGSNITSLAFEPSLTSDDSDVVHLKFPSPPPLLLSTSPAYMFPLSHPDGHRFLQIVGYCRGIMLLANITSDVFVWNPSTGAHRQIPFSFDELHPSHDNTICILKHTILHGFGYDESTHDYLLVLIRYTPHEGVKNPHLHPRIQVFSLKTNVPSFIYGLDFDYYIRDHAGLFLNQSLHWFVFTRATALVLAFDLIDRSLSEIPLSLDCARLCHDKRPYLKVLGGCLSIHYKGSGGDDCDEIWVMKEYKVPSSWTRSFVPSPNNSYSKNRVWPISFTKEGALVASIRDGTIMQLNEDGEVLEQHRHGLNNNPFPQYRHMYRESLLPLP